MNQYTFIYEQYSCLIMISFPEPLIHIEILEVYCLTFDLGPWELPVQYNCISVRLKQSAPIKGRAIWRCFDLRNRTISFLKSPVSEFIGVTQQLKHDKDTKRLSEDNSTDYAGQHFLLLTIYVYCNQSKEKCDGIYFVNYINSLDLRIILVWLKTKWSLLDSGSTIYRTT